MVALPMDVGRTAECEIELDEPDEDEGGAGGGTIEACDDVSSDTI